MDNNLERDPAEERYNREFCIPCGTSPCGWDGKPDGFHTDDEPPARLLAPRQPERTARQLAVQLNRAGRHDDAVELLATSPGLRPHVARLAAGRCEDAREPGRENAALTALARRLRQWADDEETWMAATIADEIVLLACAECGITPEAVDLAAEAVLASRAFAQPMDRSMITWASRYRAQAS